MESPIQLINDDDDATMESPIQVINDDDDDFDWEAAVREIDVACQNTCPNSKPQETPSEPDTTKGRSLILKDCRQSTLDKFISTGSSKRSSNFENPVNEVEAEDNKAEGHIRACYVDIDAEASKTWIYPDNVPRREYQLAITKTALFSNTLVALPTGLGKTLIAAVVMYNYFRWFPEGKIVFAAPSRPLVMQQIEACHNVVGIPQEWTIDMTGLVSPPKRASLWKSKRVFFVTPQVLEKDIKSGACLVKYLVCLVIDEAHRAMGNYSYCVAVRELMAVPVDLRILALTATPGSKQQTIQQVIDNLQISTLEYRNESDHDVCPYVHDRKMELIEVPMGKAAVEINNVLVDVIRPIAGRLSAMGLLPCRDFQTLSPCDLLSSRDKFRQAPPPELSHMKYSEVEAFYGVLITLYHIRKLLSSHGIRPAHEMLEEKLRQGYFARFMSKNESIQKAKLLMQQSLSHGAPSPKLSKMIEILVDHFKKNDPQNSRVIIFSNFRGSVRDILDSLVSIGSSVKATQFIGQSSGKALKGQTQKVQQAVLEKFRMGGYNVIVATSIGEEGLDIMEVDLVICFDANISPLRMIQRMGRTGRKHDGRVVVLACEGTELKGYMRKQATGRTVRKHLQNGGMNSFNFHSSPRMVAHILKPELQFEKLSIEKFVRHPKKLKIDSVEAPTFREKLTDAEASLLEKYFSPHDKIFKPSLIAFPHFQAFPSRVHRVMHSPKTGWLIDVMQLLQSFPSSRTCGVDSSWSHCSAIGNIEHVEGRQDIEPINRSCAQKRLFDFDVSPSGTSMGKKHMLDSPGRPLQTVVPLPQQSGNHQSPLVSHIRNVGSSQFPTDAKMLEAASHDLVIDHTLPSGAQCLNENVGFKTADGTMPKVPITPENYCVAVADPDLSPRLTNYIESGFVPESPLTNTDFAGLRSGGQHEILLPEKPMSPPRSCAKLLNYADEEVIAPDGPQTRDDKENEIHTPLHKQARVPSVIGGNSASPSTPEFRSPLQNLTNSSCSKDWHISSGEKSGSSDRPLRLRRLRKIGDVGKERLLNSVKGRSTCSSIKRALRFNGAVPNARNCSKARTPFHNVRDFIDEEAEVSSDDVVPDSEEEGNHDDSDDYEDSFIDDQVEPTVATTQAADSKLDMMAVYRRSLLTQSPAVASPQSMTSITTTETGDYSAKPCTLLTPQVGKQSPSISAGKNSVSSRLKLKNIACKSIPSTSGNFQANEANMDSQKRKMSSNTGCTLSVAAKNLDSEFCSHAGPSGKELPLSNQAHRNDVSGAALSDDQFYEGLDLDELEAQAIKFLSQKTGSYVPVGRPEPSPKKHTLWSAPSFDLGIE